MSRCQQPAILLASQAQLIEPGQKLLPALWAGFATRAAVQSSNAAADLQLGDVAQAIQELGHGYKQPPDKVEMYDLQTKKLTFGHLPATANFIEGITMKKASLEPMKDSIGWAERHHPNFVAKPHGPFYNWVKWMQVHLPEEEQKMYLRLDFIMGQETQRSAFLKTAQWELSRLWDWQHRRAALGLPLDLPAEAQHSAQVMHSALSSQQQPAETAAELEAAAAVERAEGIAMEQSEPSTSTSESASEAEPLPTPRSLSQLLTQHGTAAQSAAPKPDPVLQRLHSLRPQEVRALAELMRRKRMLGSDMRQLQRRRRVAGSRTFEGDMLQAAHTHYTSAQARAAALSSQSESAGPLGEVSASEQAGESASDMRELSVREFTSLLGDGSRPWVKTPLLDKSQLLRAAYQDYAAEARLKESMKLRPFLLVDDGWRFSLYRRPPTPTLDLLCDYLELKYADALMMKDLVFMGQLEMRGQRPVQVLQDFAEQRWQGSSLEQAVRAEQAQHVPLSPQEVAGINQQATKLLRTNPPAYRALMGRLCRDGLISEAEREEGCRAAAVGERELREKKRMKALDSRPVGEKAKAALLALVERGQSGLGTAASSTAAAASAEWNSVTKRWAQRVPSMREGAEQYLQALEGTGSSLSPKQRHELLEWWDTPLSLGEASRLWQAYTTAAATLNPPTLEDVVATAAAGRSRRAAAASAATAAAASAATAAAASAATTAAASAATTAAASAATKLDAKVVAAAAEVREGGGGEAAAEVAGERAQAAGERGLVEGEAQGQGEVAGATSAATPATTAATPAAPAAAGRRRGPEASLDARLAATFEAFCRREGVQGQSAKQAVAASSTVAAGGQGAEFGALLGLFPEAPRVEQVVREHLIKLRGDKDKDKQPGREYLADLFYAWKTAMRRNMQLQQQQLRAASGHGAEGGELAESLAAADSDTDSESESDSDWASSSSSESSDSDADAEMSMGRESGGAAGQQEGEGGAGLLSVGANEVVGASQEGPELRSVMRAVWRRYIQHQSAPTASPTDPVALAQPRTAPPYAGASRLLTVDQTLMLHAGAGLFEHPLGRKVRVRVHAGELSRELGMSEQATQLMLRVAGPRYNAETGEIGITCRRHARREENLRWCLDALHKLATECNRVHPSPVFKPRWKQTANCSP